MSVKTLGTVGVACHYCTVPSWGGNTGAARNSCNSPKDDDDCRAMYSRCGFGESGLAGMLEDLYSASLLVKRKQERTSFYKRLLFFLLNPHHRSADMCAGLLKRGDDGGMVNKDERFILRR